MPSHAESLVVFDAKLFDAVIDVIGEDDQDDKADEETIWEKRRAANAHRRSHDEINFTTWFKRNNICGTT